MYTSFVKSLVLSLVISKTPYSHFLLTVFSHFPYNEFILTYSTIYLLYNCFEANLMIPWKRNTFLVLTNIKWWKNSKQRLWKEMWLESDLRQPSSSVLCLKLKRPLHQRHLLLKRWTNVFSFIFHYSKDIFSFVKMTWYFWLQVCIDGPISNKKLLWDGEMVKRWSESWTKHKKNHGNLENVNIIKILKRHSLIWGNLI